MIVAHSVTAGMHCDLGFCLGVAVRGCSLYGSRYEAEGVPRAVGRNQRGHLGQKERSRRGT